MIADKATKPPRHPPDSRPTRTSSEDPGGYVHSPIWRLWRLETRGEGDTVGRAVSRSVRWETVPQLGDEECRR